MLEFSSYYLSLHQLRENKLSSERFASRWMALPAINVSWPVHIFREMKNIFRAYSTGVRLGNTGLAAKNYLFISAHFTVSFWNIIYIYIYIYMGDRGATVVKVLCYKSVGLWFDPSWCHWDFSLT